MDFFLDNFWWILLNAGLAFVPVLLVMVWKKNLPKIANLLVIFLWFLFLPNTIYLVTDLQYLPAQIMLSMMSEEALLIIQYVVLAVTGVLTYMYSLEIAEYYIQSSKSLRSYKKIIYVLINFIIAFGVILGKTQRTHSFHVFTDLPRVIRDVKVMISSPTLLLWVILFGILTNIIFFLFKEYFPPLKEAKLKKRH